MNAARAISVCAYPDTRHHVAGGKAEKYSAALLAYIFRVSKLVGDIDRLPPWVASLKAETMQRRLNTGLRNLSRAFMLRDLIFSALIMKHQRDAHRTGERKTFTMQFTPDLTGIAMEIPFKNTVSGQILEGKIPDTKLASLRTAILYHQPALARFQGPAVKADGRVQELDYQNTYIRYVKPALYTQHIVQVVWEAATSYWDEAEERRLPIDQILMRKAEWADQIHDKTRDGIGNAIYQMRELGVPSCWCEMVRFADPLPDS